MSLVAVVFLAVVGVQVAYLCLLLFAFLRKKVKPAGEPQPISIIVCAHDEEENLRELVPALLSQDHPEFEVIVVEDRCNDGTYDYLRETVQQHRNLRIVRVQHKPDHISGKKYALTLGIKAARYEHLLFTDADCRPASNQWARIMASAYKPETEIVLGFSPYQKKKGWLNTFIWFEALLTAVQYLGFAWLGHPYMGVGRNLSYKKSKFLAGKGFITHQHVTGGDDDLFVNQYANRKNTVAIATPGCIVFSKPATGWKEFLHQKRRHLAAGRYYRIGDKLILGLFMVTWLAAWLMLVPALMADNIFLLTGVFLVRLLILMVLLKTLARKTEIHVEVWQVPFLDFIFGFYYLVTGLRALVAKQLRWKN
ncbi:MAG: glycosyltransferase [Cyclobacteriaceae bacterium]|nr:glycosyltransferase [Cyclobacteriaceae bacterium]